MQTNNIFSSQRFMMLFKQSARVNKKLIWISLTGVAGTMFIALMLLQRATGYDRWSNNSYFATFSFFFFALGLIYASMSFPAFRTKEKSMTYLMLPVSTSERYLYEFLTRIVAFVLLMPLLFWVVANLEGAVVHYFDERLVNFRFSFSRFFEETISKEELNGWNIIAVIQAGLFVFIAAFTGASHFSKSPLIKTLFTFSLVVGGYILFAYLISKGLNIENHHSSDSVLFIKADSDGAPFFSVAAAIVNLSLLSIAWFRLKEKEV